MSASTKPDALRRSRRRDQQLHGTVRDQEAPTARLNVATRTVSPARPSPSAGAALRRPAVTKDMIARLAQRLWELHGGNAVLNWLEAERLLQDLLLRPTASEAPAVRLMHDYDAARRDRAAHNTHH